MVGFSIGNITTLCLTCPDHRIPDFTQPYPPIFLFHDRFCNTNQEKEKTKSHSSSGEDSPQRRHPDRGKTATNQATCTAQKLATGQRDISVSEFFAKNRHLLGFDSPRKALLTSVKEAVDNSLDACEEAGILPEIWVRIDQANEAGNRFAVSVQDNGPGIVRKQIPLIFGKLLYGSKFHRLRMSRGQQGIGISAAGMYGVLTTGKPVKIISKTSVKILHIITNCV